METSPPPPEPVMNREEPQQDHHWLQQLVGEWTYETEANMGPDQPPAKAIGTETVRSLGGFWTIAEGRGEMPGCGLETTIMTLGYSPQKQRFMGTWVGSMMSYLWLYDGGLDPEKKVLTLESEGPDMIVEGKVARYRDVIEFKSNDHRIMTSSVLGDNGQWTEFMTAHYQRKPSP